MPSPALRRQTPLQTSVLVRPSVLGVTEMYKTAAGCCGPPVGSLGGRRRAPPPYTVTSVLLLVTKYGCGGT